MRNKAVKSIEDKYKSLDHIEHILHRPQTYVGSNKPIKVSKFILNNNVMQLNEITYIPSFIKIFDEVITNSVDEHKRNKSLNIIDVNVDIDNNIISIYDNGGIPVVIHKVKNIYVPEMIFGDLMSGSNFDDEDSRDVAGLNGLGSKLTNIFSTEFTVSTCDGKNKYIQVFSNNMLDKSKAKITKSKVNFTEIKYKPDLKRFDLDRIDNDHFKMIEKRVYDLAGINPDIKFKFNGKSINFKSFEDYIKLYTNDYIYESKKDKTWSVAFSQSDGTFQQVSFINSVETYDGGTHVDYITNQVVGEIRSFIKKKYKTDLKPSEIKSHIKVFINGTVINPLFTSQTKEKLALEVKDFGSSFELSNKTIQSILKSEILKSIVDWLDKKKSADESKLERELNKKVDKVKSDKLIDAKHKDRTKCTLGLFEGDSAVSAFRKYSDNTQGAFALRGKFLNVTEATNSKIFNTKEVIDMMSAIGLKVGHKVDRKTLRYGKILFYVDADHDGNSIAGLLINFFNKFWPEIFDMDLVYKVETPILVVFNKKNKTKKSFYTLNDYDEWASSVNLNDYDINYKKGLAALVDDEYESIIRNPNLTLLKRDELSDKYLDIWFGSNSELRKNELLK